jgi:hypothetical protein
MEDLTMAGSNAGASPLSTCAEVDEEAANANESTGTESNVSSDEPQKPSKFLLICA